MDLTNSFFNQNNVGKIMDFFVNAIEWILLLIFDVIKWVWDVLWIALSWLFSDWRFVVAFLFILLVLYIIASINANKEARRKREREEKAREERIKKFYTCDACKKENALRHVKTTEVDRFPAYEELQERTAKGEYKTRQVRITKVKERKDYECTYCGDKTYTTDTRTLK